MYFPDYFLKAASSEQADTTRTLLVSRDSDRAPGLRLTQLVVSLVDDKDEVLESSKGIKK